MPVNNHDRPIDTVREEVIDQLIVNYGHEELSLAAFERRLDAALATNNVETLEELVADLDVAVDENYKDQKHDELDMFLDYDYGENTDIEYSINIFGGGSRSGPWEVPKEIRMINLFGGGDIDFTDAKFTHPTTRIRMLTLFGGAGIYVREDINTMTKTISIFGGVDNSAPSSQSSSAPLVIIEGLVMFGGVDISIKRTIKEMFLEFADRIRGIRQPRRDNVSPIFKQNGS